MIEGDAGAGERVLDRRGDAIGVAVGGDGDGAAVVHLHQRRAYILSDGVDVADLGHLAILYVPPHRRLRRHVLLLRHVRRPSVHISPHCRSTIETEI